MMRIHFSSQGYRDFGKRYAEKVMEILGDDLKPVATAPESSSSETVESSSSTDVIATAARASGVIGKVVVNAGRVSVPVRAEGMAVVAKVYSMLGNEVLDFGNSLGHGEVGFSETALPKGIYMISVRIGSDHSIQKVQIK